MAAWAYLCGMLSEKESPGWPLTRRMTVWQFESPTHCFTVSKDFVLGFGHFPSNLILKESKFPASYCTDYTRDNSMQENKQRLAKKVPQTTTEFQHFLRTFKDAGEPCYRLKRVRHSNDFICDLDL